MARLKQTAYLTPGYAPAFAAIVHQTHAGMAYFAHTGPFAATCAECEFYVRGSPSATRLVRSSAPRG
jgi:hypothetical protein